MEVKVEPVATLRVGETEDGREVFESVLKTGQVVFHDVECLSVHPCDVIFDARDGGEFGKFLSAQGLIPVESPYEEHIGKSVWETSDGEWLTMEELWNKYSKLK